MNPWWLGSDRPSWASGDENGLSEGQGNGQAESDFEVRSVCLKVPKFV